MIRDIETALRELQQFNLEWNDSVKKQLEYCLLVVNGRSSVDDLEKLNIGLIAVREIDEKELLNKLLTRIQYQMQKKYLPYAAKVRLGIHTM